MIVVSICLLSDALSQPLLSYWGFSYLGRGVSPQQPIVDRRSSKVIQDFYLYDPSFHSSLGSNTFASEIPTLIIQSNKLSILLHSNTGKTLSYKN